MHMDGLKAGECLSPALHPHRRTEGIADWRLTALARRQGTAAPVSVGSFRGAWTRWVSGKGSKWRKKRSFDQSFCSPVARWPFQGKINQSLQPVPVFTAYAEVSGMQHGDAASH